MLAKTEHIVEIEESGVEKLRRERMITCEVSAAAPANWYLIQTFPNEDMKALRWLARRGFGAFRPMQQRRDKRNGVKIAGMEPVFPGWVFGFIWNMRRARHQIEACPGVMHVLAEAATNVPVVISDDFVQDLRARSWIYEDTNRRKYKAHYGRKAKTRKRLDRHHRRTLHRLKKTLKDSGNWDQSTWEKANELAPLERIALLKRAVANGAALAGDTSSGCRG